MPLIGYLCECNHSASKFYRNAKDAPLEIVCTRCQRKAKKQLKAPSTASKLVVDNGIQSKAVEIDLNVIEDIKERSVKDFKEN